MRPKPSGLGVLITASARSWWPVSCSTWRLGAFRGLHVGGHPAAHRQQLLTVRQPKATESATHVFNGPMKLPVMPPVSPMLAKSVPSIPPGASYEPKWDGFRSICFRDGDDVELGSRNERPLTRYFPEAGRGGHRRTARAVRDRRRDRDRRRRTAWTSRRCNSASTRPTVAVRMLAEQTPASFIAFDLLALGDDDYTGRPFSERRAALVDGAGRRGPVVSRHAGDHRSRDRAAVVRRVRGRRPRRGGRQAADGDLPAGQAGHVQDQARADRRLRRRRLPGAQVQRRRDRLAAARPVQGRRRARLGRRHRRIPDGQPAAVCSPNCSRWSPRSTATRGTGRSTSPAQRTPRKNEGSRWNAGKDLSFVPLRPERVVEVRYDHMEGERFRHTAQFNRWRPDRDPRSCTYAQLEQPVAFSLGDILPRLGHRGWVLVCALCLECPVVPWTPHRGRHGRLSCSLSRCSCCSKTATTG